MKIKNKIDSSVFIEADSDAARIAAGAVSVTVDRKRLKVTMYIFRFFRLIITTEMIILPISVTIQVIPIYVS